MLEWKSWYSVLRSMVKQRWALMLKGDKYVCKGQIVTDKQFANLEKYLYNSGKTTWRVTGKGKAYVRYGSGRWRI